MQAPRALAASAHDTLGAWSWDRSAWFKGSARSHQGAWLGQDVVAASSARATTQLPRTRKDAGVCGSAAASNWCCVSHLLPGRPQGTTPRSISEAALDLRGTVYFTKLKVSCARSEQIRAEFVSHQLAICVVVSVRSFIYSGGSQLQTMTQRATL